MKINISHFVLAGVVMGLFVAGSVWLALSGLFGLLGWILWNNRDLIRNAMQLIKRQPLAAFKSAPHLWGAITSGWVVAVLELFCNPPLGLLFIVAAAVSTPIVVLASAHRLQQRG